MGTTTWTALLTSDNVMAVGTDILWPSGAQAATLRNVGLGIGNFLAKFPYLDRGNSGYFLKSARICCNFADGLVTKFDPATPDQYGLGTWALWIGETAEPPTYPTYTPSEYINFSAGLVWNEWQEINQPLPRAMQNANAAPFLSLISGGTKFLTDTVDTAYNGKRVFMTMQLLIETNYIQSA